MQTLEKDGKEQEVEKELFEWVKASEELPSKKGQYFTRIGEQKFVDFYSEEFKTFAIVQPIDNLEWLKPAALSHPTTTVLEEDLGKLNETVRQLKQVRNTYSDLNNRLSEDLRTANGKINELKEKLSQPSTVLGWVDVKSGVLPEIGKKVLVIVGENTVLMGRRLNNGWTAFFADGEILCGQVREVTQWMEAPEPPNKSNSTPTPTNETDRFLETLTEGQLKYYNEVSGALKRDYEEKMWLLKQKIMSDKDGG